MHQPVSFCFYGSPGWNRIGSLNPEAVLLRSGHSRSGQAKTQLDAHGLRSPG